MRSLAIAAFLLCACHSAPAPTTPAVAEPDEPEEPVPSHDCAETVRHSFQITGELPEQAQIDEQIRDCETMPWRAEDHACLAAATTGDEVGICFDDLFAHAE